MHILRSIAILVGATMFAGAASAQSTNEFRGFRVEGKVGADRFMALGNHDTHIIYGVTGGWDGVINERFVIGPEVSYLHSTAENCAGGVRGGTVCTRSLHEIGLGVRGGVLVTPQLLVYGKAGFAQDRQRKFFTGDATGGKPFYQRYHTDGYQVGGGLEYSIGKHFYISSEYRYSNVYAHTSRHLGLAGAGIRF